MKKMKKADKKTAPLKAPKALLKAAPKPKMMAMKAAPAAKSNKKAEPKIKLALKIDKKSLKLEVKATELVAAPTEEEEEELEIASAKGSKGSAEAGLEAAASATSDAAAGSLKNFRHHPDIENYYRFIYENDLRYEALEIIDIIVAQRANRKQIKVAKSRAH